MSSNATPSQWERNGQVDENQEQNITNEKSESQSVRSVNDENPEVLNTQIPVPAEEISTEEICNASNLSNEVNNLDIQRLTLDDQNLDHSPVRISLFPFTFPFLSLSLFLFLSFFLSFPSLFFFPHKSLPFFHFRKEPVNE